VSTIFLFCAVFGGAIIVIQVLMALLGFDADADAGDMGDVDDISGGELSSDLDLDSADADPDTASADESGSVFRVISLRTMVAAVAFFGLGGLAAQSAGAPDVFALAIAVISGLIAMYLIYLLFRSIYTLRSDGTVRIRDLPGSHGSVYLTVPEKGQGTGKVLVECQGRTLELLATTPGEALKSGANIVVTRSINSNTVEVRPPGSK
jgi:hypothetical protein